VLARYRLGDRVPWAVQALIEAGEAGRAPETPKNLPPRHAAFIVASSRLAVSAASAEAAACGYPPVVLTTELTGEAREAGRLMAVAGVQSRRTGRPASPPACLISAGETTVTVRGPGIGGRNQEIALSAALVLRGEPGILLTSFATDGKEGNSEAAGACASEETIPAGSRAGLDAESCLLGNDSHAFLQAAGELIVTGPTGANVNDLTFVLVDPG
jgi:glycerate 2-kinase